MVFGPMEKDVLYTTMIMTSTVGVDLGFVLGRFLLIFYHIASIIKNRLDSESWPRAGNPGRDSRKTDRTEISILAPIP